MFSDRFVITVWTCALILCLTRMLTAASVDKIKIEQVFPRVSENYYETLSDGLPDESDESYSD